MSILESIHAVCVDVAPKPTLAIRARLRYTNDPGLKPEADLANAAKLGEAIRCFTLCDREDSVSHSHVVRRGSPIAVKAEANAASGKLAHRENTSTIPARARGIDARELTSRNADGVSPSDRIRP